MSIEDIVINRNIKEILHFTTNKGITGMLASNGILPRKRLPQDKHLEHIYEYNCGDRSRDAAWHDYVNLSITIINRRLFGISKGKWHRDIDGWWCILAFSPKMLSHEGVFFTTTNNMYSGVRRYQGANGLEKLFAKQIMRWQGENVTRSPAMPENQPTCEQAEVLYPGELSLDYLHRIYVESSHAAAAVESILELYSCGVGVVERPELF